MSLLQDALEPIAFRPVDGESAVRVVEDDPRFTAQRLVLLLQEASHRDPKRVAPRLSRILGQARRGDVVPGKGEHKWVVWRHHHSPTGPI